MTGTEHRDGPAERPSLRIVERIAEEDGVELGPTGAITTDEYGRINVEDGYTAGDCAEAMNILTGEPDHVPLALTANRAPRDRFDGL